MKKVLKIVIAVAMAFTIAACSSSQNTSLNVLCPTGAPSLSLVSAYEDISKNGKIDFVDGSDLLQSELVKEDSEYDVIIAPINLGAKLIAANQTQYRIDGVITWGNLYLVGTDESELTKEGEIALFGKEAVPQKIYTMTCSDVKLTGTYYNSATLVQQQLISGKVKVGMLAEPAATATIAKAKEAGVELKIIRDLQQSYGENGYPQATVFVKKDVDASYLTNYIDEFTNNGYENAESLIETIGADTLGLPSAQIASKTIENQNLHYKKIADCKEEVTEFLKSFNIEFSDDMIHE
jgi:NitT/TauT family transport system substrate-binding protein